MLRSLDIRDMLIIDKMTLEFHDGLNVLTGETGAGKSILLDALGFVLGWRGRAELVREGAAQGEVTAVFELGRDHPAHGLLAEAGFEPDDDLILRRVNRADGRKTAWINDRRASGEVLRAISETLVELHGQHDDRGLLNARGHRKLLDDFANLENEVSGLRDLWRQVQTAQAELDRAHAALAAMREEEEFLRHSAEELAKLDPGKGEDATLDATRRMMQAAGKIGEDVARAGQAIGSDGAEPYLTDALRWMEGAATKVDGQFDEAIAALERTINELAVAQSNIEEVQSALDFDPLELERVEERLFAIRALARKHNVQPDDLADLAADFAQKLESLNNSDAELTTLQAGLRNAQQAYDKAAAKLTLARTNAAKQLNKQMNQELKPLKMERAEFAVAIDKADPGPEGADLVTFTIATNPGAPFGPLNKIASGGELSRFLLALKVCLTRGAVGLTMIFDEIDRGVGGATADAVGRRLAALADEAQVLVVTHSPQVAARAAHQWQVSKSVKAGQTRSVVTPLDEPARIDEIARMLAGDTITEEARSAARVLLTG